jgi:hypothetical protein
MRRVGPEESSPDDDRWNGRENERPVNDVEHVIGAGTFRLGERKDWDTSCDQDQDSNALSAFWK